MRFCILATLLIVAPLCLPLAHGQVIFHTLTGSLTSGFSSGNQGETTQITASLSVPVTNISVYNNMPSAGHLKFVIYAHPTHQQLYLSQAISVPADVGGAPSFKMSPDFSLTLEAGKSYDIGYIHDVALNSYTDRVSESGNGLSSDVMLSIVAGYESPVFDRHFLGRDVALRLHVPEPSSLVLMLWLVSSMISIRRAR